MRPDLLTGIEDAASNKHMSGAKAIYRGVSKRSCPSKSDSSYIINAHLGTDIIVISKAYWIQISGASILAVKDLSSPSCDVGRKSSIVYDDLDKVEEIGSLIRGHPVREMDNYVLDASKSTPSVRTAIILPPIIYGKGQGPGN